MAAGDVTIGGTYDDWHGMLGKHAVVGTVQLDGSNPTPVDLSSYLTGIDGAMVSLVTATAPALDPSWITHAVSGTTLNVYAWKVTASGDATLVASTNNTLSVSFIAFGDRVV